MNAIYDETGRAWELGERIGGGGEGEVYRLRGALDYCAKIYFKRPIDRVQEEKLLALRALSGTLQSVAAIPLSVLYETPGRRRPLGMVLPYVEGLDVHEVYSPEGRVRHLPQVDLRFLVCVARNLAFAFRKLHASGIIVGDISEQNIRVIPDATVRLIDCDSVQLTANGRCFPCGVGSVLWTPSELQGKSLSGVLRTENHDGFGLAQLIFLLLFCGRYPFAGTPQGQVALDPSQAIARQAFAYDPNPPVRLLSPPKKALPFDSYPSDIRGLFLRAFRPGAERTGGRPKDSEWIDALDALIQQLVPCSRVVSHRYWSGLTFCPWCEMAIQAGADPFPPPPGVGSGSSAEDAWRGLDATFELIRIGFTPVPEAMLREALEHSKAQRSGRWLNQALQKIELLRQFLQRSAKVEIQARLTQIHAQIRGIEQVAEGLYARCDQELRELRAEADQTTVLLSYPDRLRGHLQRQVEAELREEALEEHLQDCSITELSIKGLGRKRLETLWRNGIRTAAALKRERLEGLSMIGASMIQRLLDARLKVEGEFEWVMTRRRAQEMNSRVSGALQTSRGVLTKNLAQLEQRAEAIKKRYAKQMAGLQDSYCELTINREVLQAELA